MMNMNMKLNVICFGRNKQTIEQGIFAVIAIISDCYEAVSLADYQGAVAAICV